MPVYWMLDVQAVKFWPTDYDLYLLLGFSLFSTIVAYVLSLRALKHMTAFASNLTFNLEPVYGCLLAALILKDYEQLNLGFYLGMAIILLAVFCKPILRGLRLISAN
jgi:drug/metabolite transporter (DMT)-like permease